MEPLQMLFLFGKGNGMPEDLLDTSLDITIKKTFLQKFWKGFSSSYIQWRIQKVFRHTITLKINSLNVVGILQKKIQGVEGVEFPGVF